MPDDAILASVIDLAFPVNGTAIPADHGHMVYGALARLAPAIHGDEQIGIHPIRGQLVGSRLLAITRDSELRIRLPASKIPVVLPLAGRRVELGDCNFRVGVPHVLALRSSPSLASRLVIISGFTESDAFLEAARRQLVELRVEARVSLPTRKTERSVEGRTIGSKDQYVRRTTRIHGKEVVGFAVRVDQLTEEGSLRLQASGLGGRRRFGCGIFIPVPSPESA